MKTLKEFLNTIQTQLNETVPEHLQHIPDSWDHHSMVSPETHEKIRSALGPKGFKIVPLSKDTPDIDPDVADHLTKHNWQVTDYAAGMASKKTQVGAPERGIPLREKIVHKKIGSILDETAAPDHVKKAFTNDPARARADNNNLAILYSSTAHANADVSGNSTAWRDQSCMNLESGSNRHYLKQDSRYGSIPAYLIHKDDPGAHKEGVPTKALARILSKPMNERRGDHKSDTIMRAEPQDWGNGGSRFGEDVNKFNTDNFPAKVGTSYYLHPDLYKDKMPDTYKLKSKKEIEKSINNEDSIVDLHGDALDKELIDHAFNHYNKNKDKLSFIAKREFVTNMARIGNLNSKHVADLHKIAKVNDDICGEDEIIQNHGDKLTSSALKDVIDTTKDANDLPTRVLMHGKLPEEVIDKLHPEKYSNVRRSLLKPHHYQKLVDNYLKGESGSEYHLKDNAGHYTKEHLDKITTSDNVNGILSMAMNEPNFDKSHHKNLLESGTKRKSSILQNSKFATLEDLKNHNGKLEDLLKNKNLSVNEHKKIADAIVNDKDLIKSKDNVTIPEHISEHFTDKDHQKLSKSTGNLTFESEKHSNKHIDAIHRNIEETDQTISEHKNNEEEKDSDYEPEDDEVHNKLKNVLKKHISKYARAIDDHLDKHGNTEDKLDDAESNLDKVHNLENYDVHGDDSEHYYDHVQDAKDKVERKREDINY